MKRIIVKNLYKSFRGNLESVSILKRITSMPSIKQKTKNPILKNISFDVNAKESVGLIGDNGSGKSTLLRTIAKIYKHDSGTIETHGRVVPLINLAAGLHPTSTMKDNIYLVASLFGMSDKDTEKIIPKILYFSGLKDFVNERMFKFSSGMVARMAFSTIMHCKPEILILDEVFEVGDRNFRKKCFSKINELKNSGCSIILASHSNDMIAHNCERTIWLDNGNIKDYGPSKEVIKKYTKYKSDIKIKNNLT